MVLIIAMASSSLVSLPLNHLLPKTMAKTHLQRKVSSQNVVRFTNTTPKMSVSSNSQETEGACPLSRLVPLEAVLFDLDGTVCDSDPLHYFLFREMLQEVGFNGGAPISEEFFVKNISGKHNDAIRAVLFPAWDTVRSLKFIDDKEAMFLRLASQHLKPINGIHNVCKWVEERGLKRAAVTNSRRENAELMISILGLSDFFEVLVIGCECKRPKPYPEPYLKALQALDVSPNHTFVFEDSISGVKAGVAAGITVIGLTARSSEHSLIEAGANFLIKDFDDPKLQAALEELEREETALV